MSPGPGSNPDPVVAYRREISRYPLLSKEEEIRLTRKVRAGVRGARKARRTMIESNLRLVVAIAKLLRKRVALTLHTAGQDEPQHIARFGRAASWAYAHVDVYSAPSQRLAESAVASGI